MKQFILIFYAALLLSNNCSAQNLPPIKIDFASQVVSSDGKIVGYIVGGLEEKQPWRKISKIGSLDNILVLKKYRNLNIGSLLTKEFFKWCRKNKIKRITI